jgi:hypothetical protein
VQEQRSVWLTQPPGPGQFTILGDALVDLEASRDQITRLSVFDNGNDRCFAVPGGCGATSPALPPPFSRGAIFTIDESAMEASVAWQYPLNEYSFWGGNVMLLSNGDIEICASEPVPIGSPPPTTDTPSQVVELAAGAKGPQIVWQMSVTSGGAYRSYRIPSLYPGVIWSGGL